MTLSTVALALLVFVSLFTSALYLVRVLRDKKRDPFKWAVLGLLMSLALSNMSLLLRFLELPPPLWVGQVLRTTSAVFVVWATWPLIKDSLLEFRAWVCVWCHRCTAAINKKR